MTWSWEFGRAIQESVRKVSLGKKAIKPTRKSLFSVKTFSKCEAYVGMSGYLFLTIEFKRPRFPSFLVGI